MNAAKRGYLAKREYLDVLLLLSDKRCSNPNPGGSTNDATMETQSRGVSRPDTINILAFVNDRFRARFGTRISRNQLASPETFAH